jgi:hypothetical protein
VAGVFLFQHTILLCFGYNLFGKWMQLGIKSKHVASGVFIAAMPWYAT